MQQRYYIHFVAAFGKHVNGPKTGNSKAGSVKECGNYRTIALLSHTSEILLDIILNRMKAKVEAELADKKACFRPGSGAEAVIIFKSKNSKLQEQRGVLTLRPLIF